MRTARLTTLIATLLLTATAAVVAVGGSAADDTPWPHPSPRPVAVVSVGDTPWPVDGGQ